MELRNFNNQVHPTPDYPSPYGSQHSLRLRTFPAEETTSAVQFDWASPPEDAEDTNEPRNLRELPLNMGLKRAVWQVQQMRIPVVSSSWNIKQSKIFRRFCEVAKYVLSYFVLWKRGIQRIGGHFGGGVQSYFLFLRFLVILNFLSSLLIAGFVLIPSIVFHSLNFNSTIPTVNLTGVEICLQYDPKPDTLMVFITYFLDLISGTGFMEYSHLFYGYYNNSMVESKGFSYNIPLVYSQTVVWTGALFCPLLPFINTIKFLLFYYCKKTTLFQNCQPATRNFRSTTSNFFFLLVLLFGWMLATMVLLYSVTKIHPSYGCGPFRLYPTMWEVVPRAAEMLNSTSAEFLFYIGSQKFSIPLFIFSCVLLCYVSALTSVHGKSVALLKSQCKLEQHDKQFLVRQIEELNARLREPHQPQRETDTATRWNQHDNYAFDRDEDPRPY